MTFPQNYQHQGGFQSQGMILVPVQNETVVNTYLVGAGNTVAFVDFNGGKMWLKATSPQGIPETVREFELKEITPKLQMAENGVSREEFLALKDQINRLCEALEEGQKHE